jgi:AcrR family transcriptional regulator
MKNVRLRQKDWIKAGLDALLKGGPMALKAEPLARALGTTKGSFYWHFKDIAHFHSQVIAHWEVSALAEMIDDIEQQDSPLTALHKQLHHNAAKQKYEPAMRAWARSFKPAAQALEQVDTARIKYLTALLKRCDVRNPALACALYAASIGMTDLAQSDPKMPEEALDTVLDLILALR